MDESVSDSEALGSRGGRPDRDGRQGDLRGMGGACTPIRSPPGISGTEHPARVYPEAWQAGKAPVGRPLRQRPGAPAQHRLLEHPDHPKRCLGAMRTGLTIGPPEDIAMTIDA